MTRINILTDALCTEIEACIAPFLKPPTADSVPHKWFRRDNGCP